ncbi:hypothetical protein [Caulobacter endophyticus]|nr:hypothetical protein [Caulobacter endophyticus]
MAIANKDSAGESIWKHNARALKQPRAFEFSGQLNHNRLIGLG